MTEQSQIESFTVGAYWVESFVAVVGVLHLGIILRLFQGRLVYCRTITETLQGGILSSSSITESHRVKCIRVRMS